MIVANFMDSSLVDLKKKGLFSKIGEIYNPERTYEKVIHFTPHPQDLELAREAFTYGIHLRCHGASGLSPLRIIRGIARVLKVFSEEHVSIVRGRLPYLGSLIGGTAARLKGLPFVVSLGGDNRIAQARTGYYYDSKIISYKMEEVVLRMADAIIVPNEFTLNYVAQIVGERIGRKRCFVIPWILPEVKANEDVKMSVNELLDERFAIVPIIGFVNKYKFSDVLFKVLPSFVSEKYRGKPLQFVFCGDGPLRKKGEELFRDVEGVRFIGWQRREVVFEILRRSAFVLIPMSGAVLMEAASLGKPVIAGAIEWHSELVEHEETGLLVNPVNAVSWRGAIGYLVAHPMCGEEMGVQLRMRYLSRFAQVESGKKEYILYKRLIREKSMRIAEADK